MMKIAVLAALAGSASAFAPSSGGVLAYNVLLRVVLFDEQSDCMKMNVKLGLPL